MALLKLLAGKKMSSSDSERSIFGITEGLSIPELVKLIKHSFRECEYNEFQKILMEREKKMKIEVENLVRDRDSIREKLRLLERTEGLAELEKLKTEDKLQRSLKKCKELKAAITTLNEEKRVSSDRHLKIEEMYNEVSTYNSKIDEALAKMQKEIEDLRREKSAADEIVVELRRKQTEDDKVVEELKRQNVEANQKIDELSRNELEPDKECEVCKSQPEKLAPRISKIEEMLSSILNVKVEDLKYFPGVAEKNGDVMDENVDFVDLKRGNGILRKGDDDEDVVILPRIGVQSNSNSNGDGRIGLLKKGSCEKGGRNSVHSAAKDDCSNSVESSPVSHRDPAQEQNDAIDHGNEANMPLILESKELEDSAPSHARFSSKVDIIEIPDSDDETNPIGAPYNSNTVIEQSNAAENKIIIEKSLQTSQSKKRNRTDYEKANSHNVPNNENENQVRESTLDIIKARDSQTPLRKFNYGLIDEPSLDSEDESSSDSEDESLSDSHMEDLIATLQSEKVSRKFMLEAAMINAFQEDEELCMNAVCALHREQFFATSQSTKRSKLSKSAKSEDAMSGRVLAEYLIDGDKKMRLRKSVSEVKQEQPEVVSLCRRLAVTYSEELFEIYRSKKDPFFASS